MNKEQFRAAVEGCQSAKQVKTLLLRQIHQGDVIAALSDDGHIRYYAAEDAPQTVFERALTAHQVQQIRVVRNRAVRSQ